MSRYIFSGNLTRTMVDYLKRIDTFEPIDVLVSQLDRSSINDMIEYIKEGVVKSLFIDSGAFSVHTGRAKPIDVDEYISYVESIDEYIYAIAQVDTLPGKFGQPKHPNDYVESANKSWDNYLYMRKHMKHPEKLIPVFHYGESFDALQRMLDYRDESVQDKQPKPHPILEKVYPDRVNICGLSPANDSAQKTKNQYLRKCYDVIEKSSYPDIKTHLFGMTSLDGLSKVPYYSADSVSHRLRSAYNKVYTRKWGTISLSDRTRSVKTKSNLSFVRTCDPATLKEVEELFASYGFTIDQMREDNAARTAVDICETQKAFQNEYAYRPENVKRSKKLF